MGANAQKKKNSKQNLEFPKIRAFCGTRANFDCAQNRFALVNFPRPLDHQIEKGRSGEQPCPISNGHFGQLVSFVSARQKGGSLILEQGVLECSFFFLLSSIFLSFFFFLFFFLLFSARVPLLKSVVSGDRINFISGLALSTLC